MDYNQIKDLIKTIEESNIMSFSLKFDGVSIKLNKDGHYKSKGHMGKPTGALCPAEPAGMPGFAYGLNWAGQQGGGVEGMAAGGYRMMKQDAVYPAANPGVASMQQGAPPTGPGGMGEQSGTVYPAPTPGGNRQAAGYGAPGNQSGGIGELQGAMYPTTSPGCMGEQSGAMCPTTSPGCMGEQSGAMCPTTSPAAASEKTVEAPVVGTFYAGPGPDLPAFVKPGDTVKKGDILCIVEAMKIMNEINSAWDGTIISILAENGAMVEYGQPLFRISATV